MPETKKLLVRSIFRKLLVHSIFRTIQGEGPFVGRSCVFIRLGSCNLACPKCDTDFRSNATPMELVEILAKVECLGENCSLVVITGGEPFQHEIGDLVRALLPVSQVQIETNGTLFKDLPYYNPNLTIVCSPKAPKINPHLKPHIKAYKYVIEWTKIDAEDYLPSECFGGMPGAPARPPIGYTGPIYVQPCDDGDQSVNNLNTAAAIEICHEKDYILCVQTHKIIGVP